MSEEKPDYVALLCDLDSMFADYGNQEILIPDGIPDPEGNFALLTQEQAQAVFEFNDGDIQDLLDYFENEDY